MTSANFSNFFTPIPLHVCIFTQFFLLSFLTASALVVTPTLYRHHMYMPPRTVFQVLDAWLHFACMHDCHNYKQEKGCHKSTPDPWTPCSISDVSSRRVVLRRYSETVTIGV